MAMFDMNQVKKNVNKWAGQEGEDTSAQPDRDMPAPSRQTGARQLATIGPSIHIKGELTGEEGLIIDGQVEGTVNLKDNDLIIGRHGRIVADVFAKTITIEGRLNGDVHGREKVVIRSSGNVEGNIDSPRVVIEDGARFRGSIDMGKEEAPGKKNTGAGASTADKKPDKAAGDTGGLKRA